MTHVPTLPLGRGLWYVGIAATAWGTGGAAAAVLYDTSGLGPVAVSCWRFVGGVVLLAVGRVLFRGGGRSRWFRRAAGRSWWFRPAAGAGRSWWFRPAAGRSRRPAGRGGRRDRWTLLLVTGCGLALYQTAYYAAIGLAGLAVATVVTLGAGPVLVALGARVTGVERLGPTGALSVAVALGGLLLLVGGGEDAGTATDGAASARLAGIGVALVSAAGYAAVTLLTRRTGSGASAVDPYDTALGGFAVGAVVLLPLACREGLLPTSGTTPATVALLVYLGLVPTALAYGLFFAGLAVVRATTASVVALVDPVTATVVAVALLDERLTGQAAAGALVLLATVLILVLAERRAAPATPG